MKVRCIEHPEFSNLTLEKVYYANCSDAHYKNCGVLDIYNDAGERRLYPKSYFEEVNEMTKSDLVPGKHVVELREGSFLAVFEGFASDITSYVLLKDYADDLTMSEDTICLTELDVMAVYEIKNPLAIKEIGHGCYSGLKEVWRRNENQEEYDKLMKQIEAEKSRHNKFMDELKDQVDKSRFFRY